MTGIKITHPPKEAVQYARSFGWKYNIDFRIFERKTNGVIQTKTYQQLVETDLNDYFMNAQEELLKKDDLLASMRHLSIDARQENKVVRQAARTVRINPLTLSRIPEPVLSPYTPAINQKLRRL